MATRAAPHRRPNGFTLLELLVVLFIVGLLSALVVPRLLGALPGAQLQSAARAVAASLRYARSQAVFETTPYLAALDPERGLLVVAPVPEAADADAGGGSGEEAPAEPRTYALPPGIEAALGDGPAAAGQVEPDRLYFFPRGDSSGGRIVLTNERRRQYAVTVDPITGSVAIERW